MLVTCNQQYVLQVDGTPWTPVSTEGNADVYILSTGGRVTIFVGGKLAMTFVNNITPDFAIRSTATLRFIDSDGQNIDPTYRATQTYVQAPANPLAASFYVQLAGDYSSISGIETSCNQGTISAATFSATYARITVEGYDPTQYVTLYAGNVLLAFIEPSNN